MNCTYGRNLHMAIFTEGWHLSIWTLAYNSVKFHIRHCAPHLSTVQQKNLRAAMFGKGSAFINLYVRSGLTSCTRSQCEYVVQHTFFPEKFMSVLFLVSLFLFRVNLFLFFLISFFFPHLFIPNISKQNSHYIVLFFFIWSNIWYF